VVVVTEVLSIFVVGWPFVDAHVGGDGCVDCFRLSRLSEAVIEVILLSTVMIALGLTYH
jgi:hypothetical protein